MTKAVSNAILDRLARLYFRLLDLSRDVDRNRDDAAHEDSGGEIWYVFDATVLEVFINAHDARGRSASLYEPEWGVPSHAPSDERNRSAQTALACAEYLLGGSLPCQHRGTLYMTEWHRWELHRRVEELQSRQIRMLGATNPAKLSGRFAETIALLERLDKDRKAYRQHLDDKQLLHDLANFETKNPGDEEFKTFLSTRMSVDVLANDVTLEPARQLSRLVTAPLRHSFATLHLSLPPSPEEVKEIATDAELWMTRLRDECARRHIEVVKGRDDQAAGAVSVRHERALSNDAYSLAMVRWAARKKAQTLNERLVFVTADNVVFDTYRRWYAALQLDDPAYAEPFALRRLIQYAPIFNLVSTGRLEGDQYRELFQDLQNVLEKISAPLNMSLLSRHNAPIVDRMLELTALRLTDDRNISDDVAYAPLIQLLRRNFSGYRSELQQIIRRWRDLERAALGRAGEAVQRRIKLAHAADELLSRLDGEAAGVAYERLLQDLVQSLVTGPQHFSLHMAREYLNSWPNEGHRFARAPIALRIAVETPLGELNIGERLDRRLAGDLSGDFLENEEQWQALYGQPALLYAIAAAHCVASNDWTNAQQFVEIALTEDVNPDQARHERAEGLQLAEIRYLAALVYRFRMGEISPPSTGEGFSRMTRFYRQALRHIDWCEAYHLTHDVQHPLRLMRARSERAALNLFYASALNHHVRIAHLGRISKPAGHDRGETVLRSGTSNLLDFRSDRNAVAALQRAEADLVACLHARREEFVEPGSVREDFLNKLVRQFTTNMCAACVLRVLWGLEFETAPPQLRPGNPELMESARQRLGMLDRSRPTMMHADLLGYLTLSGSELAAKELEALEVIRTLPGRLSLDAALVNAIRANIARLRRGAQDRPVISPFLRS